jgi:glucose/arabinose dehydrogenase
MRKTLLALLLSVGPALAAQGQTLPTPLGSSPLPPMQPSGIDVSLTPLYTVPADATTEPFARIQYVQSLADGRTFTNNVNGTLFVNTAGTSPTPYLSIQNQNVGATVGPDPNGPGFMGVAFHPNFDGDPNQPGYGVFYTTTNIGSLTTPQHGVTTIGSIIPGGPVIQIREWTTTDPNAATFNGTSRVVIDIAGYADNHSSGMIAFNPTATPGSADYGNLYIGSGDGLFNDGNQNAQNLGVPQGKMLRINPLQSGNQPFTIPADNPFINTQGALPEVWAYGLRYPQSFGWDSATGKMYINDLGQAAIEEVDLGIAGANYGWSAEAGTYGTGYDYGQGSSDQHIYPLPAALQGLYTLPIAQYDHSVNYALGSGFVYNGAAIPALDGLYVMQDIVTGNLMTFNPNDTSNSGLANVTSLQLVANGQATTFEDQLGYPSWLNGPRADCRLSQDANGELLDACKGTGTVYQLTAASLAADIPEPTTIALLIPALFSLSLRERTGVRVRQQSARSPA